LLKQVQTSDQCEFVQNALVEFAREQNVSIELKASAVKEQFVNGRRRSEALYGNVNPPSEALYGNLQVVPSAADNHVYGSIEFGGGARTVIESNDV
jgi:hypothetical protein